MTEVSKEQKKTTTGKFVVVEVAGKRVRVESKPGIKDMWQFQSTCIKSAGVNDKQSFMRKNEFSSYMTMVPRAGF